jgi:hypothetical protein
MARPPISTILGFQRILWRRESKRRTVGGRRASNDMAEYFDGCPPSIPQKTYLDGGK